jgi:hypothetical protein
MVLPGLPGAEWTGLGHWPGREEGLASMKVMANCHILLDNYENSVPGAVCLWIFSTLSAILCQSKN